MKVWEGSFVSGKLPIYVTSSVQEISPNESVGHWPVEILCPHELCVWVSAV